MGACECSLDKWSEGSYSFANVAAFSGTCLASLELDQ